MNLIRKFLTSSDESDASSVSEEAKEVEEGSLPSSDSNSPTQTERQQAGSEYGVPVHDMPSHIERGRELKVIDEERDEVWVGEWGREMMEAAQDNNKQPLWFGYSSDNALTGPKEIGIEFDNLFTHTALFGATGFGKSTVMRNIMVQWAFGGYGFCFIDPKGDDSKELIEALPEERLDDLIWVEPSSEDHDEVVGVNFLDISRDYGEDGFMKEVKGVISDVIPILRDEGTWGQRMDEIISAVLRAMMYLGAKPELDHNYTLTDLYNITVDEEIREQFAQKVEKEFGEEEPELTRLVQQFSEMDNDEFASSRRRLTDWVLDKNTKQVIAHTDSKVNLTEAVRNDKIVIVRTAAIGDDSVKQGVSTAVIRRIWSAIRTREAQNPEDRTPYFLCVDEFDNVASEESDITSILSEARSFRLGLMLANQQPHQIGRNIRQSMLGNVTNLLAMNPRNPDDAQVISKIFDGDATEITNLDKYTIATELLVGDEISDVFEVQTFAKYPPRRPREEVEEIIQENIDKYGVPPIENEEEFDEAKFKPVETGTASPTDSDKNADELTFAISDSGDTMTLSELLRAVYTAQIENGGADAWVTEDEVVEEVEELVDATSYSKVGNALTENVPDNYLKKELRGGEFKTQLKQKGEQAAFSHADTGDSASAGRAGHRYTIQLTYETFTRLGYTVKTPEQVGEEQADLIADPPIDVAQAETVRDFEELKEQLESEHPRITQVFGHGTLNIEPEKSTVRSKPKQLLKNLKKAYLSDRDCVFVVSDGEKETGDFANWANRAVDILQDPPYVRDLIDDGGSSSSDRHFYNKTTNIKFEDRGQMYALRPDNGNNVWREDGNKIILESPEDNEEPHAEFDSPEAFANADPSDFPLTYHYDQRSNSVVVTDPTGEKVDQFSGGDDTSPTQEMQKNGYSVIKEPFIPELEYDGDIPSPEHWHIIVLPDSDKDIGPRYYDKNTGNLEPLFENDQPLSADLDPTEELPENQTTSSPQSTTGESSQPPESSKSETPSTEKPDTIEGSTPKSNTDVVKSSDEVWTKPEPGDDDYNPAKDNSNYQTGHDEERVGEDFTGGQAREIDKRGDIDEYVPPSERTESGGTDENDTSVEESHESPETTLDDYGNKASGKESSETGQSDSSEQDEQSDNLFDRVQSMKNEE